MFFSLAGFRVVPVLGGPGPQRVLSPSLSAPKPLARRAPAGSGRCAGPGGPAQVDQVPKPDGWVLIRLDLHAPGRISMRQPGIRAHASVLAASVLAASVLAASVPPASAPAASVPPASLPPPSPPPPPLPPP